MSTLDVLILVWVFAFGCAVGSFLNVCIWRLPRGMSIHNPSRSICPGCHESIVWYDNLPLVSYVLLRAKCRRCGCAISWHYPVIEGLTGLIFVAIFAWQGLERGTDPGQLVIMALLSALLIVASAIDLEFLIIPDEISVFGMFAGLLAGFLLPGLHIGRAAHHTFAAVTGWTNLDGLLGSLTGALAGGAVVLFFAVVGKAVFRKDALGFGDVKLMAMVGAFFGWKVAVMTFFVSPFFGLLYGIPLLVFRDEHVMPFGPFLSMAAVLVIVFRTFFCSQLIPVEQLLRLLLG